MSYLCVLQAINDDDMDRIATCIRVLTEKSPLMQTIFNEHCRTSLSVMLSAKVKEEKEAQKVSIKSLEFLII